MTSEDELSLDDVAQLQPLGPEMTTEQLFVMFDGSDGNCDSVTRHQLLKVLSLRLFLVP